MVFIHNLIIIVIYEYDISMVKPHFIMHVKKIALK